MRISRKGDVSSDVINSEAVNKETQTDANGNTSSDIRIYKVRRLKDGIKEGSYRVDSFKVAEKIISVHLSTFFLNK